MPRGGPRKGTPGKGYSNRTDLGLTPDMSQNTAASGGFVAPPEQGPSAPPGAPAASAGRSPDDSPNLTDPTNRPMEPVTTGLNTGPGAGQEALIGLDPRPEETAKLKRWLPLLSSVAELPDTPVQVKNLYRYIRGF